MQNAQKLIIKTLFRIQEGSSGFTGNLNIWLMHFMVLRDHVL